MTTNLDGAVVAVVGASGGLGAPIARGLGERGARLMLAARNAERLDDRAIADAHTIVLDLRDPDSGDALVTTANNEFGRLDGVINGAGIVAFGPCAMRDRPIPRPASPAERLPA